MNTHKPINTTNLARTNHNFHSLKNGDQVDIIYSKDHIVATIEVIL